MTRSIVIFIFIFTLCALFAEQVVVRFDNPTNEIIREFTSSDYDVSGYNPGEYLDLIMSIEKHEQLTESGYDLRIFQTEEQVIQNLQSETDLAGYRD